MKASGNLNLHKCIVDISSPIFSFYFLPSKEGGKICTPIRNLCNMTIVRETNLRRGGHVTLGIIMREKATFMDSCLKIIPCNWVSELYMLCLH